MLNGYKARSYPYINPGWRQEERVTQQFELTQPSHNAISPLTFSISIVAYISFQTQRTVSNSPQPTDRTTLFSKGPKSSLSPCLHLPEREEKLNEVWKQARQASDKSPEIKPISSF